MEIPYFDPSGRDVRISPPAPVGFNLSAVPPIPDEARRSLCPWCKESDLYSETNYVQEDLFSGYFLTTWTCWAGRHGSKCNYRKVI